MVQFENEENIKLKKELELYKEKCQHLEETVKKLL